MIDKIPYEKMEGGRFLELSGRPVPKYKSKGNISDIWKMVSGHIDTPETLISALFTAAAIGFTPEVANGASHVTDFFLANIVVKSFARNRAAIETKSRNLYFDTNPAQPNTKSEDYILAKRLRNYNALFSTVMVAGGIPFMLAGGLSSSGAVLFPISALVHGFNAHRFNNVLKGKWQLTDTIPQQEEKEVKTSMVPNPSF